MTFFLSDLQRERSTVSSNGVLHDGSDLAGGGRGSELLPFLRTGLQQSRNAIFREVRVRERCLSG